MKVLIRIPTSIIKIFLPPQVLIDIIQNTVSNGQNDRVIRLHLLSAVVTAAVHERNPGLLAGSVGHLGEERHPSLGLPLAKQILGGLTQG